MGWGGSQTHREHADRISLSLFLNVESMLKMPPSVPIWASIIQSICRHSSSPKEVLFFIFHLGLCPLPSDVLTKFGHISVLIAHVFLHDLICLIMSAEECNFWNSLFWDIQFCYYGVCLLSYFLSFSFVCAIFYVDPLFWQKTSNQDALSAFGR